MPHRLRAISAVNDNPVASIHGATTDEDTDISGSLSGADVDGDMLTYSIVNNPTKGSVQVILINT